MSANQNDVITGGIDYTIARVDDNNYPLFDDMVFFRMNQRERTAEERLAPRDFSEEIYALGNPSLYVYAACVSSRFIGWISIVYIPKVGKTKGKGHMFIDELWVNPAFRRKGIAAALMQKADALSREKHQLGVRLYVRADNPEALSLYIKSGFSKLNQTVFMEKEADS